MANRSTTYVAPRSVTAAVSPPKGGARVLAILLLTYMFSLIDRQILGVLAVPIKADLQLSDSQLGLLGGLAFAIFYTIVAVPIAWLADRANRVTIITVSLALWSLFTATCGVAQSFGQMFLARVGVGIGEGGGTAPAHSLIGDYFPSERRAQAIAIFSIGAPLGAALGILLGGWIASEFHWRAAFIAVGLVGLLLVPFVKFGIPEPVRGAMDGKAAEAALPAPIGEVARTIGLSPTFWLLSMGAAIATIPNAGLIFWLPSLLQRSFGLELVHISMFQGSLLLIGGVFGTWFGGWLCDRLGRANKNAYVIMPAIGFLIAAPAFALAMFAPSLPATWLLLLLWQALIPAWLGPVLAAIQHIVAPNMRSIAAATFLLLNNLIGIGLGTFLLGVMSDVFTKRWGEDALMYSMLCFLSMYVVAAVMIAASAFYLKREWRHATPSAPAADEIPQAALT